ncbi:hypothetical protein WS71_16350 [Burkholderia mayonis]|uniref:Uncharacterized protein n=1 Tax=Burkholderia mayonis TaxID=1385591 RepID=A0A1B4FZ57_9BURK|nr:hypothetical protein WS71_16350 [Burkholderia mayonis]KVE55955.1 hypothetical protein WS71_30150 [Burkholderia mayonis]
MHGGPVVVIGETGRADCDVQSLADFRRACRAAARGLPLRAKRNEPHVRACGSSSAQSPRGGGLALA